MDGRWTTAWVTGATLAGVALICACGNRDGGGVAAGQWEVVSGLASDCEPRTTNIEPEATNHEPRTANHEPEAAGLRATWGIEPQAMRLTAGGYMLDFRYKVVDPEKAKAVMDPKVKPYLRDLESGAVFLVPTPPKVGALRQTYRGVLPRIGTIQGMMFANPGQFIKAGRRVAVVAGDCTISDLIVQ